MWSNRSERNGQQREHLTGDFVGYNDPGIFQAQQSLSSRRGPNTEYRDYQDGERLKRPKAEQQKQTDANEGAKRAGSYR